METLVTPMSSEKNIRMIERENKLCFIIDKNAKAKHVKKEVEDRFKVKVVKVNTLYDTKGRKKAYVKLSEEDNAMDIATSLGLI
ncbi:MAG: 50S ribosomal protein L23 [Candidatus Woesearchaeota archaeon]